MELLIKKRSPLRGSFTKIFNSLNNSLKDDTPIEENIRTNISNLRRIRTQLTELDNEICNLLLQDEDTEKYQNEYVVIEEYNEKMVKAEVLIEMHFEKISKAENVNSVGSSPTLKRKLKLPRIELLKFSGGIKDWLAFWSQFKRIHENESIENEDKFQYLIQCMSENSRAREIIDSFPPTSENYDKAIECLKSRFGRDELLIEFYIRELLKLVVKNVTDEKRKLNTSKLYDKLESHLRALETLGLTSDKYSAMLFPLVESCIPEEIFRVWLRNPVVTSDSSENVYGEKLKNLLLFLKAEVEGEERIRLAKSGFTSKEFSSQKEKIQRSVHQPTATDLFAGSVETRKNACIFCDKIHESKDCFSARKLNFQEKQEILKNKKACFVCLKIGHRSKFCKANIKCVICSKKHSILMCPELPGNKIQSDSLEPDQAKSSDITLSNHCSSGEILLQTLQVKIKTQGKERRVRVLLDSGSQHSYVLKRTARELDMKPVEKRTLVHSLFGGFTTDKKEHHSYRIKLASLENDFSCDINVLDQQAICGEIPRLKKGFCDKELREKGIWLSDYGKNRPEIELLIGADQCGKLFTGKMQTLKCNLVACETYLGWVVMGGTPIDKFDGTSNHLVTSLLIKNASVSDLWKLDALGITDPTEVKTKEEKEEIAVQHFLKTVQREENGRYIVKLPWLEDYETLSENKDIAEKRCMTTTQRLLKEEKYADYDAVFKEWLKENIIEEVPENQLENPCHYLPHRGVFKKDSTTKVRPVFDASCRSKNSPSLNECLETGPNLIEKIPPLLMRFRQKEIGVVSDIRKAFLQISVASEDRDFLRFVWWKNYEERKLAVYRHRRVVFGLTSSPFLLAAVLDFHLRQNESSFPETVEKLRNSFYVDNCVISVSNKEELSQFIQEARHILAVGCFDLRGWEHSTLNEEDDQTKPIPVLGLLWDKNDDVIFCDVKRIPCKQESVTRRSILSTVQSIFDPIGFLCPVTICLKLLVQKSWTLKIGWDDVCPEDVCQKFNTWLEDLHLLTDIKIPRYVQGNISREKLSLHTFCDASKSAYSAVVFLRSECEDEVKVHLIEAKSRVAPLSSITIPRLELLACCIGARLSAAVKEAMNFEEIPNTCWTDSSTVLHWIENEGHWGKFVANRVKEIRNLTLKTQWKHISGSCNPADLPSRGCSVKTLLRSRWWEGPQWLRKSEKSWPTSEIQINMEEVSKERRKGITALTTSIVPEKSWYLHRFSKYCQIIRLTAWILRFYHNAKNPRNKLKKELSVQELKVAERKLLTIIQKESFTEDAAKTRLKTLSVFTDQEGLIRLKTKIVRRDDTDDFVCPIVLPSDHQLVEKLITERHLKSSHAGVQVTLADIRQQFWILRGRKTIQRIIAKCIRCRRYSAKKIEPIPAPLPEDRVRDARVFEVTGVDLAGPLHLKDGNKCWILLFTCAVYRAVHLELIQSLSTNGFILGFRRFIARRGRPKTIYSDNGTNFVGADNLFRSLDWNKIVQESSILKIQWKFNPPTAAWWGGWWERIIQMVKKILRRVLGRACLKYEEISTILCDTEAVINSRPLNYLSEDPEDLMPLTPSMFIQDIRTVGVPDLDNLDEVNISKRYQHHQKLRENLRNRFRNEYLSLLVQPKGKKSNQRPIQLNDIVLIGSDNKKRLDWPMGRVTTLIQGKDNYARVAKIKTASGEIIRPVQRLYPLEAMKDDLFSTGQRQYNVPKSETFSKRTELIPKDVHKDIDSKDPCNIVKTKCGRTIVRPSRYN